MRGLLYASEQVARRWRLLLAMTLLGALLAAGWSLAQPRQWASEGYLHLRPLHLFEGYLLTTNDLTAAYALHLRDEQRVARVLDELGWEAAPRELLPSITTRAEPGGILYLRALQSDPERAELLTQALLRDLQQEIELENRTRDPLDRVVVERTRSRFAQPANPPLLKSLIQGAGIGVALGILLALWVTWRRYHRVASPLEAEQLVGAPTLTAIPPHRSFSR